MILFSNLSFAAQKPICPDGPAFRTAWEQNKVAFLGTYIAPQKTETAPVPRYDYAGRFRVMTAYKGIEAGGEMALFSFKKPLLIQDNLYLVFANTAPGGAFITDTDPCDLGR